MSPFGTYKCLKIESNFRFLLLEKFCIKAMKKLFLLLKMFDVIHNLYRYKKEDYPYEYSFSFIFDIKLLNIW